MGYSVEMTSLDELDKIAIDVRSRKILNQLLDENPKLAQIIRGARDEAEALEGVRDWVMDVLRSRPHALTYYEDEHPSPESFQALEWRDYAALRLLDYIENANREFVDLNLRGDVALSNPIKLMWLADRKGTGGANRDFFEDLLHLFRQFSGSEKRKRPNRERVEHWMGRYPSGLEPRIVRLREENRERILTLIIEGIDSGEIPSRGYRFAPGMSHEEKLETALEWWKDSSFHLRFAVRSPDLLNRMLEHSLNPDTMKVLHRAHEAGIPFFVNPYYLSLLHTRVPHFAIGADLAIRDYVLYSEQLVNEFGHISAWEKEDIVEPGKPNAAGWILPTAESLHRRYPDVAILIPETQGRACGGLCTSCQRMYDFQRGHLTFELDRLGQRAELGREAREPDGLLQGRFEASRHPGHRRRRTDEHRTPGSRSSSTRSCGWRRPSARRTRPARTVRSTRRSPGSASGRDCRSSCPSGSPRSSAGSCPSSRARPRRSASGSSSSRPTSSPPWS